MGTNRCVKTEEKKEEVQFENNTIKLNLKEKLKIHTQQQNQKKNNNEEEEEQSFTINKRYRQTINEKQ
jgi:hypothetical protein